MRLGPAGQVGTLRDDPRGIDLVVGRVVVPLDVVEVRGVAEAGRLEEVAGVRPQVRELGQLALVALEVAVVDGVEAHERGVEPHVGLGQLASDEVALGRQVLVEPGELREQRVVRLLVAGLRGREARLVDPVVDGVEVLLRHVVDRVAGVLRVQVRRALAVQGRPLRRQVERDLRVVVGHDPFRAGVPDERDGGAALEVGVGALVQLHGVRRTRDRVDPCLVEREAPALLVADRVDDAQRQGVLEAEQPAHDDRAVRPRAGQAHVEHVAARLDGVAAAAVGGDPVREPVRLADERAVLHLGELRGHCSIPSENVASRSCLL